MEPWMPQGGLPAFRAGQIENTLFSMVGQDLLSHDQEIATEEILGPSYGLDRYRTVTTVDVGLCTSLYTTGRRPFHLFNPYFPFLEPTHVDIMETEEVRLFDAMFPEPVVTLSSIETARVDLLIDAVFPTSLAITPEEIGRADFRTHSALSSSQILRLYDFLDAEPLW
jgi:hypothetical protein